MLTDLAIIKIAKKFETPMELTEVCANLHFDANVRQEFNNAFMQLGEAAMKLLRKFREASGQEKAFALLMAALSKTGKWATVEEIIKDPEMCDQKWKKVEDSRVSQLCCSPVLFIESVLLFMFLFYTCSI